MSPDHKTEKYIALLRGINVGGHHKLPMADLKKSLARLGYKNIITLLNSGNVIFEAPATKTRALETSLSTHLEKTFQFPVPVLIRTAKSIEQLYATAPFEGIEVHKDIRLYVSFLREDKLPDLTLPWSGEDDSFRIISRSEKAVHSVLDLSVSQTPKAMDALEKMFGKDITTRNWKTIERIIKKL
jgi:uncharacterized protein (DUF1697 family)